MKWNELEKEFDTYLNRFYKNRESRYEKIEALTQTIDIAKIVETYLDTFNEWKNIMEKCVKAEKYELATKIQCIMAYEFEEAMLYILYHPDSDKRDALMLVKFYNVYCVNKK